MNLFPNTWGEGKTSSSDGQRFELKRKVLQQTYSAKFRDFAIEFYSFVADNYAPFYSIPIEWENIWSGRKMGDKERFLIDGFGNLGHWMRLRNILTGGSGKKLIRIDVLREGIVEKIRVTQLPGWPK